MPNRNPHYKVYVGDDRRLLDRVSLEAYGVYCVLRLWAHDAEPYAHLVDARGLPLSEDDLRELARLKATLFRRAWRELLDARAVQPARAWLAEIEAREHKNYVEIAANLIAGERQLFVIAGGSASADVSSGGRQSVVMLLPSLADQHVRTEYGRHVNRDRRKGSAHPAGVTSPASARGGGDVGGDPPRDLGGDVGGDPHPHPHGHDNDNDNAFRSSRLSWVPGEKEKKSNARVARESFDLKSQAGDAPWSWAKHVYLADQVRKFDARLRVSAPEALDDPDRYAAHFLGEFHFEYLDFLAARDFYAHGAESRPIPQPCLDGYHVPDSLTDRCRYCGGLTQT